VARKRARTGRLGLTVVELIGLGLSVFLLLISFSIIYKENLPCPRGGIFACHSVLRGRYAYMGPFPVAAMGVFYFVMQLALTFAMGKRTGLVAVLKALSVFVGVGFIAWLRVIEIVWLQAMCPWCLAVGLAVIVQGIMLYDILAPPLPKLKSVAGRTVMVIFGLFSFIGIGAAVATFAIPRRTLPPLATTSVAKPPPRPSPGATPVQGRTNGKATPKPTVVQKQATPEPEEPTAMQAAPYPDTPEGRVLRDRGWSLAPGMEYVNEAATHHAPVLLLAYDPECPECEHLITKELSKQQLDNLPVTRVAIDQRDMWGTLSSYVLNVPTLLLLLGPEIVVYRYEGRISAEDIISAGAACDRRGRGDRPAGVAAQAATISRPSAGARRFRDPLQRRARTARGAASCSGAPPDRRPRWLSRSGPRPQSDSRMLRC
jgi:uncharacterized membrane protein